jgi:hypothetical protein
MNVKIIMIAAIAVNICQVSVSAYHTVGRHAMLLEIIQYRGVANFQASLD